MRAKLLQTTLASGYFTQIFNAFVISVRLIMVGDLRAVAYRVTDPVTARSNVIGGIVGRVMSIHDIGLSNCLEIIGKRSPRIAKQSLTVWRLADLNRLTLTAFHNGFKVSRHFNTSSIG